MKKIVTLVALVATAVSVAAAPELKMKTLPNFGTTPTQKTEIELKKQELASKFTPKATVLKAVASDATIDIAVANITDSSAVATITPTDLKARWFVTYTTTAEYKYLLDSLKSTDSIIDLHIRDIDAKIQLNNMFVGFFGGDSVDISDYTQMGVANTPLKVLDPKTAYTVLAFYVDTLADAYHTNYKLATAEFTTNDVTPSENVITLNVKDDTLHIATTNADKYLLWIAHKDTLDALLNTKKWTIDNYLDTVGNFLAKEDYLGQMLYSGDKDIAISALMPTFYDGDGKYIALVAPFTERGYRNGELKTAEFEYTKPAPKVYNITLETATATSLGYDAFTGWFESQVVFYQKDATLTPILTFDLYAVANQSLVGDFKVEDNTLYTGLETSWVTLETGDVFLSDGEISIKLKEKQELTATYEVSGYVALDNYTNDTCIFSGTIAAKGYDSDKKQIELERKTVTYNVTLTNAIGTSYSYDGYPGSYPMYISFYQGNNIKITPNFTFNLYTTVENSLIGDYSIADWTIDSYESYITFDSGDMAIADGKISIKLKEKQELTATYEVSGQIIANNGDTCNLSGTVTAKAYSGSDDEQIELEPGLTVNHAQAVYYAEHSKEGAYNWTLDLINFTDEDLDDYDVLMYINLTTPTQTKIAGDWNVDNGLTAEGSGLQLIDGTDTINLKATDVTLKLTCVSKEENYLSYDIAAIMVCDDGKTYTVNEKLLISAIDDATDNEITLDDDVTAIRNVEVMNDVYANAGRIYAEEGARIYTVTGLDVTRMNGSLDGIYIVKAGNKVGKIVVRK